MKNHSFTQFRPSALRTAGLLMIISGLVLVFGLNIRSKPVADKAPDDASEESIMGDYFGDTRAARKKSASSLPFLMVGGTLIIGGIPMFFVPYTDKGVYLRSKMKRKKKDEEENEKKAPEPDYPDGEYDFIIRREIYEINHKEELEKVRQKHND